MRRVGVLTDIMRRYRQSETSVCGSPKVRNQKKLHFIMFIFYFYIQVSLGLKQLQFLIAILIIGILISLILCSIEKVYHVFKRKNTVNTIEVKEYPNSENIEERRMIFQHFQDIVHSKEEQILELTMMIQEIQIFLDKQTRCG